MIEDGKNPFESKEIEEKKHNEFEDYSSKEDLEIMSVVEDFESE